MGWEGGREGCGAHRFRRHLLCLGRGRGQGMEGWARLREGWGEEGREGRREGHLEQMGKRRFLRCKLGEGGGGGVTWREQGEGRGMCLPLCIERNLLVVVCSVCVCVCLSRPIYFSIYINVYE